MLLGSFQFQNGAIISRIGRQIHERHTKVSIPKWCDYKKKEEILLAFSKGFQFQNGAIIRVITLYISIHSEKFQFQNGAIISQLKGFQQDLQNCFNSKMVRL